MRTLDKLRHLLGILSVYNKKGIKGIWIYRRQGQEKAWPTITNISDGTGNFRIFLFILKPAGKFSCGFIRHFNTRPGR